MVVGVGVRTRNPGDAQSASTAEGWRSSTTGNLPSHPKVSFLFARVVMNEPAVSTNHPVYLYKTGILQTSILGIFA